MALVLKGGTRISLSFEVKTAKCLKGHPDIHDSDVEIAKWLRGGI